MADLHKESMKKLQYLKKTLEQKIENVEARFKSYEEEKQEGKVSIKKLMTTRKLGKISKNTWDCTLLTE